MIPSASKLFLLHLNETDVEYPQIQGIGAILVDKIDGSFDNVVGLPLRPTLALIEKVLRNDEELVDEFAEVEDEE